MQVSGRIRIRILHIALLHPMLRVYNSMYAPGILPLINVSYESRNRFLAKLACHVYACCLGIKMVDFRPSFFKTLLQFLPPTGILGIKNVQVVGSRPHPTAKVVVFRPHFWAEGGFDSSLRLRWKVFYHCFGKSGSFSLIFSRNVVDFVSTSLL